MDNDTYEVLIVISGIGHLALSAGSLFVPKALNWKFHLKDLQPLIRQIFWTYAAYILMINICFGLICLLGTDELLNHSFLAKSINLMIGGYWLIRIGIQFFYFNKKYAPKGIIYSIGEIILIILFIMFAIIHVFSFLHNQSWMA